MSNSKLGKGMDDITGRSKSSQKRSEAKTEEETSKESYKQSPERITTTMLPAHTAFLDRFAADFRMEVGRAINRAEILRALISILQDHSSRLEKVDLSGIDTKEWNVKPRKDADLKRILEQVLGM